MTIPTMKVDDADDGLIQIELTAGTYRQQFLLSPDEARDLIDKVYDYSAKSVLGQPVRQAKGKPATKSNESVR